MKTNRMNVLYYLFHILPENDFKLAVNSSQQVKDDGIIIIGLGISSQVKPIMLKALASSEEQILLVPHSASPVKKDITGDLISMICEGKFYSNDCSVIITEYELL